MVVKQFLLGFNGWKKLKTDETWRGFETETVGFLRSVVLDDKHSVCETGFRRRPGSDALKAADGVVDIEAFIELQIIFDDNPVEFSTKIKMGSLQIFERSKLFLI